jgi:uncharacterized membrane protein
MRNLVIGGIIFGLGLALVGHEHVQIAAGVYLMMWGNNIQRSK